MASTGQGSTPDEEKRKEEEKRKRREAHQRRRAKLNELMGPGLRVLFMIYFISLTMGSLYVLVAYWQVPTFEQRSDKIDERIKELKDENEISKLKNEKLEIQSILGGLKQKTISDWFLFQEVKYFIIVGLSGIIGSTLAAFRSFQSYYGNKQLKVSWTYWYLLRPFEGVVLAIMVYFILRSGSQVSFGLSFGKDALTNLFALATMGSVSGLFTRQVFDKFKEAFDTLFQTKSKQEDALGPTEVYPNCVASIIGTAVYPDDAEVAFWSKKSIKDDKSNIPEEICKTALEPDKEYWRVSVTIACGTEIYWIRDSDCKIVCRTFKKEEKVEIKKQ